MRRWLSEVLAAAAGLDPTDLLLYSGHDPRWGKAGDQRCPDLLLLDVRLGIIRLVVEAKALADVNGRVGYCSEVVELHCCQPVCYVYGCWTDHPLGQAKFLLVAPGRRIPRFRRCWDSAAGSHPVGDYPWEFFDLKNLFEQVAKRALERDELGLQTAVLTHLIACWYWADVPEGVPFIEM